MLATRRVSCGAWRGLREALAEIAVATGAIDQLGRCSVQRQSVNPPFRIGDGINVVRQHDLLCRVIKAHSRQPASMTINTIAVRLLNGLRAVLAGLCSFQF
jgi:hypothetical protein